MPGGLRDGDWQNGCLADRIPSFQQGLEWMAINIEHVK